MANQDLAALVVAAQQGDSRALDELFNESYQKLHRYARQLVKNDDLAADITQSSCEEIIETLHKLEEPGAFVVWSRRIVYHQCTNHFRKNREFTVGMDEDEDGDTMFDRIVDESRGSLPEQVQQDKEFQTTMLRLLDTLPDERRAIMMLYYYDQLPVKQIAGIQEVEEHKVKNELFHGRKVLKKKIEEYEKKTGKKMFSIVPLPLLLSFLFGCQDAELQERCASALEGIRQYLTGLIAAGAGGAAAAGTATGAAATATGTATATGAGTVGAGAGTGAAIGGGTGAAGAVAGVGLGVKIAAGVAAAAICIGGAVGGVALLKDALSPIPTADYDSADYIFIDSYMLGTWQISEYSETIYGDSFDPDSSFTLSEGGTLDFDGQTYYLTNLHTYEDPLLEGGPDPYIYVLDFSSDPDALYSGERDGELYLRYELIQFVDPSFHGVTLHLEQPGKDPDSINGVYVRADGDTSGPPHLGLVSPETGSEGSETDDFGAVAHWNTFLGQWEPMQANTDKQLQILPDFTAVYDGVTYRQYVQQARYTPEQPLEAEADDGTRLLVFCHTGQDGNRWIEASILVPSGDGMSFSQHIGNFYLPEDYRDYTAVTLTPENIWDYVQEGFYFDPDAYYFGHNAEYTNTYLIFRDGLGSASWCSVNANVLYTEREVLLDLDSRTYEEQQIVSYGLWPQQAYTVRRAGDPYNGSNMMLPETLDSGKVTVRPTYQHILKITDALGTVFVPNSGWQAPEEAPLSLPDTIAGHWGDDPGDYVSGWSTIHSFTLSADGTALIDGAATQWTQITALEFRGEQAIYCVGIEPEAAENHGFYTPYLVFQRTDSGKYLARYMIPTEHSGRYSGCFFRPEDFRAVTLTAGNIWNYVEYVDTVEYFRDDLTGQILYISAGKVMRFLDQGQSPSWCCVDAMLSRSDFTYTVDQNGIVSIAQAPTDMPQWEGGFQVSGIVPYSHLDQVAYSGSSTEVIFAQANLIESLVKVEGVVYLPVE